MKSAQDMIDISANAEDGHFEQKMFDGRSVIATDFGQRLILRDFRSNLAKWTEKSISYEELRTLIWESEEAESIAKHGY